MQQRMNARLGVLVKVEPAHERGAGSGGECTAHARVAPLLLPGRRLRGRGLFRLGHHVYLRLVVGRGGIEVDAHIIEAFVR